MGLNIGKKIKQLRLEQNITQEQLAEALNISYQAVSKWEKLCSSCAIFTEVQKTMRK